MKCRCGHESEHWEHVKVYKMNTLVEDIMLCPTCVYINGMINLLRLKKRENLAYREAKKTAQKIFDRQEKEKDK